MTARPSRHLAGDRWFVDETYLKVAGRWVYLYRAIDQHGQVIDVLVSPRRDLEATRRFFARALTAARPPTEVTTDRAPAYPRVLEEAAPQACHVMEQYANNPSWPSTWMSVLLPPTQQRLLGPPKLGVQKHRPACRGGM